LDAFGSGLPASEACRDGEAAVDGDRPCCEDSFVQIADARDDNGEVLERGERFCGRKFGDDDGIVVTSEKPFHVRVRVGEEESERAEGDVGFALAYELLKECP